MFCMHCGQQLPDNAQFCFQCGNKIFTEQDLSPVPEVEPAPASVVEPSLAPQPAPVGDNGSHVPSISEPDKNAPKADVFKEKTKPVISKLWANKVTRYITLGVLALLLIVIVIVAIPSKASIYIPDPEVYFGIPMVEKDKENSIPRYQYSSGWDMTNSVRAYALSLRDDYRFVMLNANEDETFLEYHFFHIDNSDTVITLRYINDGFNNKIVLVATKDIGFKPLGIYSSSQNEPVVEEDKNEQAQSKPVQNEKPVTQEESQSSSLKDRNPAVLPDFTAYDSSNSYKHYVTYLPKKEPMLLCIGYESSDTNSTYAVQDYMNALFQMGYKLDEEHSFKSTFANMPAETFYLYHPNIPVSFISGTRGQIQIDYRYTSNNKCIHIYIRLPETIVMEGFETAYATEKAENEAEAKESSSSNKGSSGGSSGGGTPSVDRDIYDVKTRCGVCHGDGDCNKCGGDGKVYSSASKKEDRNCPSCSGRGNCRSCGGDGWVGEG